MSFFYAVFSGLSCESVQLWLRWTVFTPSGLGLSTSTDLYLLHLFLLVFFWWVEISTGVLFFFHCRLCLKECFITKMISIYPVETHFFLKATYMKTSTPTRTLKCHSLCTKTDNIRKQWHFTCTHCTKALLCESCFLNGVFCIQFYLYW